jgi:eukaryotic-like serine/threonine-protein kinase
VHSYTVQDQIWKTAFAILERAQELPLPERQPYAETQTSDPETLALVAELLEAGEAEAEPEGLPQTGDRFAHYEVLTALGRGGSGQVYAARDLDLDRPAALKFLSGEVLVRGRQATELLIHEAKAASALNHPNIVTIYGVVRDEISGRTAIAMERIEGQSLRAYCKPGLPEALTRVYGWVRAAASALESAHAAGIVHRDIKPENMMVRSADDGIKILDFGLARRPVAGKQSSRAVNTGVTIDYCSPEQAAGQRPTSASDVFSLGVVLYELAAGRHPFPAATPLDRLYAIGHRPHEPLPAALPRDFQRLLQRMLAKQPADRPTAAVVERTLALAQIQLSSARPPAFRVRYALAAALTFVALAAAGYYTLRERSVPPVDSIAILPFRHADGATAYLGDGLRHEIALGLATTPGLRVAANSNLKKFQAANLDVRKAGEELGVASVLSGSLSRTGNSTMLDLEVFETRTGKQLWSGQFEQPNAQIATFPRNVSGRIAARLGARVATSSRFSGQHKPEAYEAYLRARYHYMRRSRQDMAQASEHCEKALALEPQFAEAWALLAASLGYTPGMYNSLSPRELYAKTHGALAKAIEIDPSLPEVHLVLGGVKLFQDRDWAAAESELRQTIALNPSDAQAHLFLAILMRMLRRQDEERLYVRRARELDPLSTLVANHVAWTEYFRGNDEAAQVELQRAFALDAKYAPNYTLRGYLLLRARQFPSAIAAFQRATETASGQGSQGDLGYAFAVSGDRRAAQAILRRLESGQAGYTPAGSIAWIYLGLGERDAAFRWFAKACDENYHWLNYLNIWSVYDVLREDPRTETLIRRLRLESGRR